MNTTPYILIVDDTPEHIHTAGTILKSHGYQARIATTGQKAVNLIAKAPPAIVLLDVRMPDMNGFEVCQWIRNSSDYQNVAVIFITADHDRAKLQKGFEIGGQDYILKPYHPSELIARINTQMMLYHQRLQLQKSYMELGKFCHNVSHDLKNPIHIISALSNELCAEALKPDSSEITTISQQLQERCAHTINMVETLLKFAELSEETIQYSSIELTSFIQAIASDLISIHPKRQIEYLCDTKLPTVSGDAKLLHHLFENVLNNAIKFSSRQNKTTIRVSSSTDAYFYHIFIKDNGIGVDNTNSESLFQVFKRGSVDYEGTGIGLALARQIASMHNGRIAIFSDSDIGATVHISLPIN